MINSVYFSDKGLTSTSANFIANKAKEYCQDIEQSLKNVEFFNTSVNLIGSNDVSVTNHGITNIEWIPTAIETIGQCNSLIAWLREAIKERENALNAIRRLTLDVFCDLERIAYPKCPEVENALTEEEYYNSLPIKEKNRYYSLEAQASAIGKYIHLEGSLNKARKKLSLKIQKPHEVQGTGRDTIIWNYTPTVSISDVDDLFFELQNKHREIQSQLNAMKFECEKAMKESAIKVEQEYKLAYSEYINRMDKIRSKMRLYIEEQTKFIGNLKIVIPDKLKNIYNEISQLGK